MDNWSEIKDKILFSYMGCDWTSVQVSKTSIENIIDVLNETVKLNENDTIYSFEIASVKIFFYTKSNQHFDFDPKEIKSADQWSIIVDFFKNISKKLNAKILFRPEDSSRKNEESVLIQILGNDVTYNFDIKADYENN